MSNDIYISNHSMVDSFVNLPAELKAVPNWVCFKIEPNPEKPAKPAKVPYQPSGNRAKSNDQSTWSSYEDSVQAFEAGGFDGIGFMFAPPYVGIDLDHCVQDGIIASWASDIVCDLDSYTEQSPSGTGVHIILKGVLPAHRRREGPVEMYSGGRFFTMTGQHIPEFDDISSEVKERGQELLAVHSRIFPARAPSNPAPPAKNPVEIDDLLFKAGHAKDGLKFERLFTGDTSDYQNDQSRADYALCCKLAFWTGRDAQKMDAVFRQSGLMRSKWDERHGSGTYGQMTIQKAIDATTETYRPTAAPPSPQEPEPAPEQEDDLAIFEFIKNHPPQSLSKKPIKYLIEPEIPEGTLVQVTGKPASGKSTLVLLWCKQMAEQGNNVLILDRDNGLMLTQERIERFGDSFPAITYWGLWTKDANGEPSEPPFPNSEILRQWVRATRSPVIVFDTFAAFSHCDENDNAEVAKTYKALRALQSDGATVLIIHHSTKDGDSPYRGASSQEGAIDAGIQIKSKITEGRIETLTVETFKTRLGDGKPIVYKMVDGIPVRQTVSFNDVLFDLVKQNPGLSKVNLEKLAMNAGFRRATVRDFFEKYISGGQIKYRNNQLYTKEMLPPLCRPGFDRAVFEEASD